MRRQRVIGRIRYLRNLEIWNVISIPAILAIVMTQLNIVTWRMMVYAILVMVFMFLQGAIYWDSKYNSLIQRQLQLPESFRTNFVTLRWFNIFFLALYPIAIVYGSMSGQAFFATDWWSHSVYSAAVLVYINYYHWQLSHDNPTDLNYLVTHQTLRRSPLNTDLYPHAVTVTKPILVQRQSVVFRGDNQPAAQRSGTPVQSNTPSASHVNSTAKSQPLPTYQSQPIPTVSSQSQPLPTYQSQPIPTVSSQSQPLPTYQSQPIPTVSSQSQPLPTYQSQPIPTVSSQSQPLPTYQSQPIPTISSQSQPLPTYQSQPIPTVSSQSQPIPTLDQSYLAPYITQPLPIIDDSAVAAFIEMQNTDAPEESSPAVTSENAAPKKSSSRTGVKRTPMKKLQNTDATEEPTPAKAPPKSTSRSKTKPPKE